MLNALVNVCTLLNARVNVCTLLNARVGVCTLLNARVGVCTSLNVGYTVHAVVYVYLPTSTTTPRKEIAAVLFISLSVCHS